MGHLFADENYPLPVVEELRGLGHDVVTMLQAGMANQRIPDDALLAYATSQSRAVLTLNRRHFVRLHNSGARHAGIIVCTFDPDFGRTRDRRRSRVSFVSDSGVWQSTSRGCQANGVVALGPTSAGRVSTRACGTDCQQGSLLPSPSWTA
jgi:hypothetical protein